MKTRTAVKAGPATTREAPSYLLPTDPASSAPSTLAS